MDDSTAVILGVARTLRSVGREITFLNRLFDALADQELMAGVAAMNMGAMMQLAIPVIGVISAALSIVAGAAITSSRAAIPVAQTRPGQFREVKGSGTAHIDRGEIIGTPPLPQAAGAAITSPINTAPGSRGGSGLDPKIEIHMNDVSLNTKQDILDTVDETGRQIWYQVRTYKSMG